MSGFSAAENFVAGYKHADEMIESVLSQHSLVKWKEIERKYPSSQGLDFLSFYVAPVQRYPRYKLLLRDLLKSTPDFHPDRGAGGPGAGDEQDGGGWTTSPPCSG
jgi:hypothetical protein